jgi:hypothetical protein
MATYSSAPGRIMQTEKIQWKQCELIHNLPASSTVAQPIILPFAPFQQKKKNTKL